MQATVSLEDLNQRLDGADAIKGRAMLIDPCLAHRAPRVGAMTVWAGCAALVAPSVNGVYGQRLGPCACGLLGWLEADAHAYMPGFLPAAGAALDLTHEPAAIVGLDDRP